MAFFHPLSRFYGGARPPPPPPPPPPPRPPLPTPLGPRT